MKVRIVCYEDVDAWILGKFALKLQENLQVLGAEVDIAKQPDLSADINHHIIYYDYNGERSTIDTVMITHIDTDWKLERILRQLQVAEMGICMSSDTVNKLAARGVPREKLCHVLPAHDEIFKPRPLQIGITSRIYNDNRKREYLLLQLSEKISPEDFAFKIMGAGWDDIVAALRSRGFTVEYVGRFDYEQYRRLVPTFDYYLYLGLDEGAMGFIDALAAGIPTIVTPQGYHLDAQGGISHPFVTLDELVAVFREIAQGRRRLVNSVSGWTWQQYAEKHLAIWNNLLDSAARTSPVVSAPIGTLATTRHENQGVQLKILVCYDEVGWAWWHRAHNVKRHVSPKIAIDILKISEPFKHEKYDFILLFESYLYRKISHVPQHKVILGSSTLMSLPSAVEVYRAGHFAGFIVNNLEAFRLVGQLPNVFCCQNGVDEGLFYFKYPRASELTACWVGNNRSMNNKGIDLIKDACDRAGVKLLLVDQSVNVYAGNLLSQEQLRDQIYHNADFYICASEMEGTPNPALESLACGLPVISTRVGNMPEIIVDGYNGFLVDRSVNDLVAAIERIRNSSLPSMSINARASIEQGWSWKNQAARYERMFFALADKPMGSGDYNSLSEYKNNVAAARDNLQRNRGNYISSSELKKLLLSPVRLVRNVSNEAGELPVISIVIPFFQQLDTVEETLASICQQTFRDFEVVFINDGDSEEVVQTLGKFSDIHHDVTIKYYWKENSGLAGARNFGVSKARGKYILPLDSDDMIASIFLEETVDILETHPAIDFVYTEALFWGAKNEIWATTDFEPELLLQRNLMTCTTLYRREMWEKIGGYSTNMKHGYEDWDFWISAVEKGFRGTNIHLPLFIYRRKANSMLERRNEYDLLAKTQIIENHPALYRLITTQTVDMLKHAIGIIPHECINPNIATSPPSLNRTITEKIPTGLLKILFICHDFPPYRYAGAQLYALNLAKEINKTGLAKIDILHPVFREGYDRFEILEAEFEGLKIFRLSKDITVGFENSVRHPEVERLLDRFLSDHAYDCIHIHGLGQLSARPIEVAKRHGIPTIMTLHDYWLLCAFWHLTTPDQKLCSGPESPDKCSQCFLKYHQFNNPPENLPVVTLDFMHERIKVFHDLFAKLDCTFAPSRYLAGIFAKFGFKGIQVNPLGMPAMLPETKVPHRGMVFGFVGQIITRKGIEVLLTAFSRIKSAEVSLEIWGRSDSQAYLDSVVECCEGLTNVSYKGSYTPEQLPGIFAGIDVAVVPSLMENYPLVVQEAFMNGTPVVASTAGGIPEVVLNNHNGLLFEVGNASDLEEKLCHLIANPTKIAEYKKNIANPKTIFDDANFYAGIYKQLTVSQMPTKVLTASNTRILFYFFKNVHIPILKPIYEVCKRLYPEAEIGFACMPHAPEMRAGFLPEELQLIHAIGEKVYQTPQEFHPDITFIADSVYPWVQGCGKLVHVGHGVLSKGQYYTNTEIARREQEADLVCVPGFHHAAVMKGVISKPVIATGMAKLDPLFSGKITRESALDQLCLPSGFRYILFSPTFNDELSAIPFVMDDIHRVLPDGQTVLLIKLHGSTKAEYKQMYRALAKSHPRVYFCDNLDITPFLAIADVMISDVSSSMMEFAALDKPVVLFNNPNWTSYPNYNPTDIEFTWRNIGIQVNNLEEMRQAVYRSLEQPAEFSETRRAYTDMLFANKRNGDGAERIVTVAMAMFRPS